jgi:hypothetical protein
MPTPEEVPIDKQPHPESNLGNLFSSRRTLMEIVAEYSSSDEEFSDSLEDEREDSDSDSDDYTVRTVMDILAKYSFSDSDSDSDDFTGRTVMDILAEYSFSDEEFPDSLEDDEEQDSNLDEHTVSSTKSKED